MNQKQWLAHIQSLEVLVEQNEQAQGEERQCLEQFQQLTSGPLRHFFLPRYLNTWFACAIILFLFSFHTLFGNMLIASFQLLSLPFFLYKALLFLALFILAPLFFYVVGMYGINRLIKNSRSYKRKLEHAKQRLDSARTTARESLQQLLSETDIPPYYLKPYAIQKFKTYFLHQRADNLKEAINLFETEKTFELHQYAMFRFHGEKKAYRAFEKALHFEKHKKTAALVQDLEKPQ
ncbi:MULTISPECIES: hypothetical protein [Shouchella]|uniref:hypothetical protein n=1 Tax=Shouchella TaxID=2893057 RepID=UPI0007881E5B|nr:MULTISPECIES: hypothetical protein [Shouchella]PTL20880.1 hypothetical protein DA802_20930 [Shouchella clausii]GIN12178.1 hypothetical protein J26TS2_20450 [Shouchella clausii]